MILIDFEERFPPHPYLYSQSINPIGFVYTSIQTLPKTQTIESIFINLKPSIVVTNATEHISKFRWTNGKLFDFVEILFSRFKIIKDPELTICVLPSINHIKLLYKIPNLRYILRFMFEGIFQFSYTIYSRGSHRY